MQGYIKDFFSRNYTNLLFYIWIVVVTFMIFKKGICRTYSIINIGLVLCLYGYLYYAGRVLARVEYGILMSSIFSLLICWLNVCDIKINEDKKISAKVIAGTLILYLLYLNNRYINQYSEIVDKYQREPGRMLEYFSENEDAIYLLDVLYLNTCFSYEPYKRVPEYYYSNFYYMGGWSSNAPYYIDLMRKMNLENPMSDLIYKDNTYYVKSAALGVDMEVLYLRENYNENVEVNLIENYGSYNIYQFYIPN